MPQKILLEIMTSDSYIINLVTLFWCNFIIAISEVDNVAQYKKNSKMLSTLSLSANVDV